MIPPNSINSTQLEEFKLQNLEGSSEMYASILNIFLSDAPKMISEIRAAVSNNIPSEAKGPAHNLKSNSAALGAVTLSHLAKEIEKVATDSDIDSLESLYEKLMAEYEKIRPFYESELQRSQV